MENLKAVLIMTTKKKLQNSFNLFSKQKNMPLNLELFRSELENFMSNGIPKIVICQNSQL